MQMKQLKESHIAIVGLARNVEKSIEKDIENISFSFSEAKTINWIIIESDSNDSTAVKIESLSKNFSINLIQMGNLDQFHPKRTERLARCRNEYLRILSNDKKYSLIDYVVIADLDGINSKLSIKAVSACFNTEVNWDACFANQAGPYYDIWALRHPQWCAIDCWEETRFYTGLGIGQFHAEEIAVKNKMIKIPQDASPIPVLSAFGGLGIYKKHAIKGCSYSGTREDNSEVCEHVKFHDDMVNKGMSLFIIPALINNDYNDHTKSFSFHYRLYGKMRKFLKRFSKI